MFGLIVGAGLAAGTYLYAKNRKRASTGQSVAAAAVTGAAGWGAVAIVSTFAWPLVFVGAVAGAYYVGRRRQQKALPPASEF